MLKVVGASWLQTRISTYILVAVALLGIGAIVLGEFGRIDNDGTYAATVTWNHKGGYRIDFWGQGNDLRALPRRAARAYYKARIHETGWSSIEIETSPNYPDAVQAYAAGLLEGSLTWQLIHHHWYNTISAPCIGKEDICDKIREKLKENAATTRNRADIFASEDSFWHMTRLFYAQLDGLEAGWKFAVKRSKKTADISSEDFLWLAMASDISNFGPKDHPTSENDYNVEAGGILLKYLANSSNDLEGMIGIIHSTAAPYQKMLRLLKKYTFGYHVNSVKNSERVPTRSIVASSYPGALSSQDEYYIIFGKNTEDLMVIAGTPLAPNEEKNRRIDGEIIVHGKSESHTVMSPARIMSANWLSSTASTWGTHLAHRKTPDKSSRPVQWILTRAGDATVWIIEQQSAETRAFDYTKAFAEKKSLFCNGQSFFQPRKTFIEIPMKVQSSPNVEPSVPHTEEPIMMLEKFHFNQDEEEEEESMSQENEEIGESSHEETSISQRINKTLNSKLIGDTPGAEWIMGYRGDFENERIPFGNIDTKLSVISSNGIETFEATSGPFYRDNGDIFEWRKNFPKIPHVGQPERFHFDGVRPFWVWY